jgi:DNA-binding protein HU-beta
MVGKQAWKGVFSGFSLDSSWVGGQYVEYKKNLEVPMNKTEMAMKLAKKTGVSQGKAAEIIDAMFSAHPRKGLIATALDAGEKVTIPGFGTFATKHRGARQGRNPATGATITIPAKKYVHFKPGKTLRERVEH